MVSLRFLRHLRLHPSPAQGGYVSHTFLYFHPDSNVPLEQPFHFRLESDNSVCVFEAINNLMRSEYVITGSTISSLHRISDVNCRSPGDGYVLIFLRLPSASPRGTSMYRSTRPAVPRSPICDSHVIALGVQFDATVRPVTYDTHESLLQFFEIYRSV
ncbi:hypothetical protein F5878DRAFT_664561 [Lentinula raphanica]|uniref:Uncharacterized protein n=1 Tax=Lentinula raphanica TaxID=153919 RepID=A0AA38UA51_9AGAR|nr:hypothetical protein F5878DRAFT_664561 [Lentinula raphanica]